MRKIRLVRSLGFFDSVMLGIGFIIGSGIFIMPLVAAQAAGTYSLIAWILGGIYQILTGLCFAECAAKIPKVGGLYTYAHQAFGDFVGFFTGWTFWIGYVITIAAEQWALGWYLKFFVPQYSDLIRVSVGVLTGLVLTYFNFRSVKSGGRVDDIFTVGKLFVIFIFIVGAAIFFKVANLYPLLPTGATALPAVGSATIIVLYAYLGAEIITVPESEVKNAKKTIPKAIIISAVATMVIYLLVAGTFLGAARWTSYSSSESPLADLLAGITNSQLGGTVIAIGGLVSIIGALSAVILATARISYSMSKDELFPKIFAKLHPKYKTPYTALILQTVIALVLTYTAKNFVALAALAVFFTIVPYAISSFATIKLIKKTRGKMAVINSRATPMVAGIVSVVLLGTYWNQPATLQLSAVLLFVGLLLFIERKKIQRL